MRRWSASFGSEAKSAKPFVMPSISESAGASTSMPASEKILCTLEISEKCFLKLPWSTHRNFDFITKFSMRSLYQEGETVVNAPRFNIVSRHFIYYEQF